MTLKVNDVPIKKVYLAGKMSGEPDWGFAAFQEGASELRCQGLIVYNPADNENGDTSKPRDHYMRIDVDIVTNAADAVVVLHNWKRSSGALTETRVARECGKPVIDKETLLPVRETVYAVALTHAQKTILQEMMDGNSEFGGAQLL